MTTEHPTFTLVLLDYPDGTWSAEPVGMGGVPGYVPEKAGPEGCFRRGPDLSVLFDEARAAVSAATNLDRFGFDLRFCCATGECVARSDIRGGHETLYMAQQAWARVGPEGSAALLTSEAGARNLCFPSVASGLPR